MISHFLEFTRNKDIPDEEQKLGASWKIILGGWCHARTIVSSCTKIVFENYLDWNFRMEKKTGKRQRIYILWYYTGKDITLWNKLNLIYLQKLISFRLLPGTFKTFEHFLVDSIKFVFVLGFKFLSIEGLRRLNIHQCIV